MRQGIPALPPDTSTGTSALGRGRPPCQPGPGGSDARILNDMKLMKKMYASLHEVNGELIGEYVKPTPSLPCMNTPPAGRVSSVLLVPHRLSEALLFST